MGLCIAEESGREAVGQIRASCIQISALKCFLGLREDNDKYLAESGWDFSILDNTRDFVCRKTIAFAPPSPPPLSTPNLSLLRELIFRDSGRQEFSHSSGPWMLPSALPLADVANLYT